MENIHLGQGRPTVVVEDMALKLNFITDLNEVEIMKVNLLDDTVEMGQLKDLAIRHLGNQFGQNPIGNSPEVANHLRLYEGLEIIICHFTGHF